MYCYWLLFNAVNTTMTDRAPVVKLFNVMISSITQNFQVSSEWVNGCLYELQWPRCRITAVFYC